VDQHDAGDSGGLGNEAGPKKDAERRDKVSTRSGKETQPRQGLKKPSETSAMLKTAPLVCDKKQPES
jgi:hypothetical protein